LPQSTLNFKAYKQEQPAYGSYNRTSDASAASTAAADRTNPAFAPVQVHAPAQSSAEANASLQLNVGSNTKQVWGTSAAGAEEDKTKAAPVYEPTLAASG